MNNHLSPHDRFFRSAMINQKVSHEFFSLHLPENIKNIVAFNSIKLQKDSFINDNLKSQISDLLFSAEFNQRPGYFYLLVEHQSTPQKLMPLRMLKYIVAIFEQHLKITKSKCLPIVYPMLFYNGRTNYNYSTDIFDLFEENKKLAQEILFKPFQLIDLTKIPTDDFNMLWYGTLVKLMKNIFAKDFLPKLKLIIQDIKLIESHGDFSYIYSILSYIVAAGEIQDKQEFHNIIKTGLTKIDEEQVMTLAEIYRQEGRQEGEQKGEQRGKQEALRSIIGALLRQNFTTEQIAKLTELSIAEVNRLKEQTH